MSTVYADPPRTAREVVAGYAELAVATVHEAQGRTGLDLYGMRHALARKGLAYTPRTGA